MLSSIFASLCYWMCGLDSWSRLPDMCWGSLALVSGDWDRRSLVLRRLSLQAFTCFGRVRFIVWHFRFPFLREYWRRQAFLCPPYIWALAYAQLTLWKRPCGTLCLGRETDKYSSDSQLKRSKGWVDCLMPEAHLMLNAKRKWGIFSCPLKDLLFKLTLCHIPTPNCNLIFVAIWHSLINQLSSKTLSPLDKLLFLVYKR